MQAAVISHVRDKFSIALNSKGISQIYIVKSSFINWSETRLPSSNFHRLGNEIEM